MMRFIYLFTKHLKIIHATVVVNETIRMSKPYILSRVGVTETQVWLGNWIYKQHTGRNYKLLLHSC
jgi:hypothetical protein